MSKFVGTGPSSYKKRIYRAVVLQRLRNTDLVQQYVSNNLSDFMWKALFKCEINFETLH